MAEVVKVTKKQCKKNIKKALKELRQTDNWPHWRADCCIWCSDLPEPAVHYAKLLEQIEVAAFLLDGGSWRDYD